MGLPGCLFVCHLILLLVCFLFNHIETIKHDNANVPFDSLIAYYNPYPKFS